MSSPSLEPLRAEVAAEEPAPGDGLRLLLRLLVRLAVRCQVIPATRCHHTATLQILNAMLVADFQALLFHFMHCVLLC